MGFRGPKAQLNFTRHHGWATMGFTHDMAPLPVLAARDIGPPQHAPVRRQAR